MGPAILLCPSSSAVQLWGQIAPLKKTGQREGSISLSNGYPRRSAHTDFTGNFKRRQAFFFNPAASSEKFRKPTYPFAWRRVSAAAAAGSEVSVEEAAVATSQAPAEESSSSEPSSSNEEAPIVTDRKTQARRTLNRSNSNANKAVVVSPAELLPGAAFPGKVISIQTFGAFVDLGAFTNGLIHISRLSKSYVKKVEDVVQVGQDVKVQVLEFDQQANRISLMLVEEGQAEGAQETEAGEKQAQRSSQQQARPPRRESSRRPPTSQRQAVTTTMKKNETVTGTVKNIIRSGVFVTLPDGTDGYLQAAEVIFKGPNTNMESQFQVGQELSVRVLRIDKGRVSLTMRKEMDYEKLNEDLNKGVVDGATNPFEIAFRRNELIASFLADRDRQKVQAEADEETKKEEAVNPVEVVTPMEKPAVEEVEDTVNGVDAGKVEDVSTMGPDEPVKDLQPPVEAEDVVADKDEQKVLATNEVTKEDEAVSSVDEVKDVTLVEKSAVEEDKDVANGVDARKDESVSSEAVDPVELKDVAEEEKPAVEEVEDTASVVGAVKAEDLSSETGNPHGAVKDLKLSAEEEEEVVVADGNEQQVRATDEETKKDEAVSSVNEPDDATQMEKPAVEEEKDMAMVVDARKDEGVSSEAGDPVEDVKDVAELGKPGVVEDEELALRSAQ